MYSLRRKQRRRRKLIKKRLRQGSRFYLKGKTMNITIDEMITETRNKNTYNLDCMSAIEIVTCMNQEDSTVPESIKPHLESIAQIATVFKDTILNGGHVYYMGAGTSGRLGILDAVECPPTFGVSNDLVVGLIAGEQSAIANAKEDAEDDEELGKNDLLDVNLTSKDMVIGLAASGRTPYVIGGLKYANSIGCKTASITCNKNSLLSKVSMYPVDVVVGPEVVTGSTRLKAGTAEKMILNMISTTAMILSGKVYQNLMVDVKPTNEKLNVRAVRIIMDATDCSEEVAKKTLELADDSCKTAIIMILTKQSKTKALELLQQANGHVRKAINNK